MDDTFQPTPSRRQANSSPDPEMVESGNKRGRRMVGDEGRDATRGSGFTIARQRVPTLRIRSMAGGMAEKGGEGQSDGHSLRGRSGGGVERRDEVERFLKEFGERLAKFGLELHPEKTRM